MRHRMWIPVTAIIVALALFLLGHWYFSPDIQAKIRTFVEQKIAHETGGKVHIGKFSIGLLSITASDITMDIPKNSVDFSVEKIRIGFSLEALLKRHWAPAELLDRITVIKPSITVTLKKSSKPEPLPARLSVRDMIPFRIATVKDASILIKSPKGVPVFATKGLNGTVVRQDSTADISLTGSIGSLTQNSSVFLHLSNHIEDQQMSIRVKNLDLKNLLMIPNLKIRGKVNASIETSFREKLFPYSLIPDGKIEITNLWIAQKKEVLFTDGVIKLILDQGTITSRTLRGSIPGGECSAAVKLKIGTETIHGTGAIDLVLDGRARPIKPITEITGTAHATFSAEDLTKPYFPITLKTSLVAGKEKISANGFGVLTDKGIDLKSISASTQYGTLEGSASYLAGFAKANGSAKIKYQINKDFHIAGTFPFGLTMKPKAKLPEFMLFSKSAELTTPAGVITIPDLTAKTSGEALTVSGKNGELSVQLFTEMFTDPLKSYKGSVSITPNGVAHALVLAKKTGLVNSGSISVDFSGKNSITDFHGTVLAETNHEKVTIFTTGTVGKDHKSISIDQGIYSRGGYDFPFTALLDQISDGWKMEIAAVSGKFLAQGKFSPKFDSLKAFSANIEKSNLDQLNAFLPESDFPIKDGNVSASIFASGPLKAIAVDGYVDVDAFSIGGLDSIRTSLKVHWLGTRGTVDPFSVTRLRQTLITSDTVYFGDTTHAKIELVRLDIGKFLSGMEGDPITGVALGHVTVNSSGIAVTARCPSIRRGQLLLESIAASATIRNDTLRLDSLTCNHLNTRAKLVLTFPLGDKKTDTLSFKLRASGDLLNSAGQFKESPVGGHGEGTVSIDGSVCNGDWQFSNARVIIPNGSMAVYPYVRGTVDNLYADLKFFTNDSIALQARGKVGGRSVVLKNDYAIGSLKPMNFGNINLGVIRLYTQEGGIPLFIPGFLENRKGNVGYIEVAGKDDIPAASLSGSPPDDFMVNGTLLIRKAEITFPLLNDVEWPSDFDPFPMVGFNLDVQAADRSVTYFYQVGDAKKRRALRLIEATIDPSYTIGVRGRAQDGDFRITGGIRAYKGFLFYGKMFDQNFEMGLDFSSGRLKGEHDNLPVIWGSAESFSDTNRLDRSEVVVMTKDLKTGELVRKGRLTELVVVPASGVTSDSTANQDEQSAEFYRNTGRDITKLEGVGSTITGIGDVYVNSFLFNYWGRRLARKVNLDMIRIESSVMSNTFNYFYNTQRDSTFQGKWTKLAWANTGLTLGKYVANDQVLLKMRGQVSAYRDSTLVPEFKLGMEYQPLRYLWMDLNYGLKRDLVKTGIMLNPEIRIQLRMPFSRLSNAFLNR